MSSTADALAKGSGFVKRTRKLSGGSFARAVVFGRLAEPEGMRKQLQISAGAVGVRLSVQGLDQRFTPEAVVFMRALLEEGFGQRITRETDYPVLQRFAGLYVTDCTRIEWPGGAVKVGVRLELQRGGLQACLSEVTRHDQATPIIEQPLPVGALHLGDLGFFKLERFKRWSAEGVSWLTRYKIGTTLATLDGQRLDLPALLTDSLSVCQTVRVGQGRHAVEALLLAEPLPETERPKRLARLQQQARDDQRPLSALQLALVNWTLYLTNIPDLTCAHARTLARARWQIELLFKLWKSHGAVLRSRSADPIRQQVEGYAKLLGLLIAHWSLLVADWDAEALSPLDALRIVRTYLPFLCAALQFILPLADFHFFLQRASAAAAHRHKRRKQLSAPQLWAVFDAAYP